MSYLVLLRHGQTDMNLINLGPPEGHVITGQYDVRLNDKGRSQAKEAGLNLASMKCMRFRKVVTSDSQRTKETARLLIYSLGYTPDVQDSAVLRERSAGVFDGKRLRDLEARYPDYFGNGKYNRWRADFIQKAPGGENFTDVTNRIRPYFENLLRCEQGDILVVSHIRVICCTLGWLLKLPNEVTTALKIPHCVPIIIERAETPRLVGGTNLSSLT